MLPSAADLRDQLKTLPPTLSSHDAAVNFINIVGDFMDQVQGGPTGVPGIFIYNRPPAIALIEALPPVIDNSWITNFANAIHSGTTSATLVPGTVTSPAWTASGTDTVSPPTITNLAGALSLLVSELPSVTWSNDPPMPLAQAIYDYTSFFIFLCTGLVLIGGVPTPLPLTFPAQ